MAADCTTTTLVPPTFTTIDLTTTATGYTFDAFSDTASDLMGTPNYCGPYSFTLTPDDPTFPWSASHVTDDPPTWNVNFTDVAQIGSTTIGSLQAFIGGAWSAVYIINVQFVADCQITSIALDNTGFGNGATFNCYATGTLYSLTYPVVTVTEGSCASNL